VFDLPKVEDDPHTSGRKFWSRGSASVIYHVFPEQQNAPKALGGRGFSPDPTGGAYSTPRDLLAGGEKELLPTLPKNPTLHSQPCRPQVSANTSHVAFLTNRTLQLWEP